MIRKFSCCALAAAVLTIAAGIGTAHAVPPPPDRGGYPPICNAAAGFRDIKGVTYGWVISPNFNTVYPQFDCQFGKARFVLQSDDNLVVYDEHLKARWASNTRNKAFFTPVVRLTLDGELAVYDWIDDSHMKKLWSSPTCCSLRNVPVVQADGNVVIYDTMGHPENTHAWFALWSTGSNH
jgi:hypothetical protein